MADKLEVLILEREEVIQDIKKCKKHDSLSILNMRLKALEARVANFGKKYPIVVVETWRTVTGSLGLPEVIHERTHYVDISEKDAANYHKVINHMPIYHSITTFIIEPGKAHKIS